ncbi:MAG: hypothetical protein IJK23_05590 [Clostridia bacterium]|nr:hypothetical protein [Clostridia bacterium]
MKKIIKTIYADNGKLYATASGRRGLLAECTPKIEIIEESHLVKTVGGSAYPVKKIFASVVICGDMEYERDVDLAYLKTVTDYALTMDVTRRDGIAEEIQFVSLIPVEITLDDRWIFELGVHDPLTRRFMTEF